MKNTLDKHAPVTKRRTRDRPTTLWYSAIGPELREAKRLRRKAERKWRKTGLAIDRQRFQYLRNRVTDIVHKAKSAFFSSKIIDCTSSKELFDVTKTMLNKSKLPPLPSMPSPVLSQKFADFFIEKIEAIRKSFDNKSVTSATPTTYSIFTGEVMKCFHPVSEQLVKKLCLRAAPKTCIIDPLPTPLFLECLDVLLPYITSVFNSSLTSGVFPTIFKSAIVRPTLKKPSLDSECLHNYRPISTLPFLSKILEKIVLSQLLCHLTSNNLLNANQSAYRAGHSTETTLSKVVNDLLVGFDNHNISVLTLLDLSSAFDTVDFSLLLSRLERSYGIAYFRLCSFLVPFLSN